MVVYLLGNSATLTVTHAEVAPVVVSAIEDIGYTAEVVSVEPLQDWKAASRGGSQEDGQVRVELSVGGMTCASCVRRVEKGLAKVDGVAEAGVNLATENATNTRSTCISRN